MAESPLLTAVPGIHLFFLRALCKEAYEAIRHYSGFSVKLNYRIESVLSNVINKVTATC